jgi:hypothetical protein
VFKLPSHFKILTVKIRVCFFASEFIRAANPTVHLGKIKGKTVSVQAWTGPEGYRSLGLPDFKTIGT